MPLFQKHCTTLSANHHKRVDLFNKLNGLTVSIKNKTLLFYVSVSVSVSPSPKKCFFINFASEQFRNIVCFVLILIKFIYVHRNRNHSYSSKQRSRPFTFPHWDLMTVCRVCPSRTSLSHCLLLRVSSPSPLTIKS